MSTLFKIYNLSTELKEEEKKGKFDAFFMFDLNFFLYKKKIKRNCNFLMRAEKYVFHTKMELTEVKMNDSIE